VKNRGKNVEILRKLPKITPAPQTQQIIYFGDWNTNPQYQT
jgi:hypothetical protein